jgi:predicted DNA-binding antitoxin AbrB/MazE fold protein
MSTVHAKFEDGIFKPVGPVELPDHCEVEFEPRVVVPPSVPDAVSKVYEIMARRHDSGETDVAERHNEHQP